MVLSRTATVGNETEKDEEPGREIQETNHEFIHTMHLWFTSFVILQSHRSTPDFIKILSLISAQYIVILR